MKRSSMVGLLAAGGLLLTACSSGSTTAGSSTAATAASSSSAASSSPSSAASSSAKSSSAGSSSSEAPAAELDAATETWFTTFCTSLGEIGQYTSPDTAGNHSTSNRRLSSPPTPASPMRLARPRPRSSHTAAHHHQRRRNRVGDHERLPGPGRRLREGCAIRCRVDRVDETDLKTSIDAVKAEAKSAARSRWPTRPRVETTAKQSPASPDVIGS